MIGKILDTFAAWFKEAVGITVLYDPQPVMSAEPAVRMVFLGADEQGANRDVLLFQFNLVGSGDGPDVYLASIIDASLRIQDMLRACLEGGRRYVDLDIEGRPEKVRVSFSDLTNGTGSFTQNEPSENETSQWRYTYAEPHTVRFDFPRSLREDI